MGASKLSGMQKQVLSLYRGFLRTVRSKPIEDRKRIEMIVSAKFRQNSKEVDRKNFQYIEYLLRLGTKQLDQLKSPDIVTFSSMKFQAKETGANVVSKLPFTGTGTLTGTGTEQGQDKGVSTREYLSEKLSPGEEDKVLSEVVAEKLHLGGGETEVKKGRVTQSEEVEKRLGGFKDPSSEAEMKHGKEYAEEGEGGMAEKLAGAVSSWLAGTTEEVTQKSTESVQDSSTSLGSTVGNKIGMSGSGGDGAGQRHGNNDDVPLQGRFQGSGN